jgi:WD40 repeat protein
MKDGTLMKKLTAHTNSVESVHFSDDNRYLASGSDDGTCALWSLK